MLMMSKPKDIDGVVSKFVIKTLYTTSRDMDYEYLKETTEALYANDATLPTTLDGEKHGHVVPIMKDSLYATLETGTPWEDPDDRG